WERASTSRTPSCRLVARTPPNHIENELSASSSWARSTTCAQVRSAASSNDVIAIAIHSAFPQLWKLLGEEMASCGEDRRPRGTRPDYSTAVFPTTPPEGPLVTLSRASDVGGRGEAEQAGAGTLRYTARTAERSPSDAGHEGDTAAQ